MTFLKPRLSLNVPFALFAFFPGRCYSLSSIGTGWFRQHSLTVWFSSILAQLLLRFVHSVEYLLFLSTTGHSPSLVSASPDGQLGVPLALGN